MELSRHIRLFRNGSNQAIRIPRDMELQCDEAILHREGDKLIIEPVPRQPLLSLLATLDPIAAAFPDIDTGLPSADDITL